MIFERYPPTSNHTLQAWNAADEWLAEKAKEHDSDGKKRAVFNDRFGFLSCHTIHHFPDIVIHLHSQKTAILQNLTANHLAVPDGFMTPFTEEVKQPWEIVFMHIPKSMDLFEWFLSMIHRFSTDDVVVYCSFMTRHFTKSWQEIASRYFAESTQSLAVKKARILTLTGKKKVENLKPLLHEIRYQDMVLQQYYGVFSKEKVDLATMFLLENLTLAPSEKTILDWGCGNGIIGHFLRKKSGQLQITGMDDSILAVLSARLNNPDDEIIWDNTPESLPDKKYDLIVSNPPFHFEYETDISIALGFFEAAAGKLQPSGRLVIVANRHINYLTFLKKMYSSTEIVTENQRFVIYQCRYPNR